MKVVYQKRTKRVYVNLNKSVSYMINVCLTTHSKKLEKKCCW